jgi:HK97 family phage major capsid protein
MPTEENKNIDARSKEDDALIAKVAGEAAAAAIAAVRAAPAVHTDDRKNSKDYLDDMVEESVGKDRMDVRRENERKDALQGGAAGFNPTSGERSRGISREDKRGTNMAQFMGFFAVAGGNMERAGSMAKRAGAPREVVRALSEGTFASGGALIPQNFSSEFIELLYNINLFLAAGPRDMAVRGNLTLPRGTGGATSAWVGEAEQISASTPAVAQVKIDLKKLANLVVASQEFLDDADAGAAFIRDDMAKSASAAIDAAAIRGLGTAGSPRGLRGWVPSANYFQSTGVTVATITADLNKAMRLIEEGKILSKQLAWFTSPKVKFGLMAARDGNNNEVWASELRQGTLYGAKFGASPNIPTNVGSGSTKSEIYLAAMDELVFAHDAAGMRVSMSDSAAYHNGTSLVSAFAQDEVVMKLTQRVDIVERQNGAGIAMIYDVAIA